MRVFRPFFFAICLGLTACSRTPSAQEVLGVPLPASARDVRVSNKRGLFGGDSYLSVSISSADYMVLTQQLSLRHRGDLLEYWPSALTAHDTAWWTVTVTNDSATLFAEQPSTYIVTRFESDRLYFKRHVY